MVQNAKCEDVTLMHVVFEDVTLMHVVLCPDAVQNAKCEDVTLMHADASLLCVLAKRGG